MKKGSHLLKILCSRIESKRLEHRNDSARRFRKRRVVYKQRLPNEVRPFGLVHFPKISGRDLSGAKCFGNQIVIGKQVVDSGQAHRAKLWRKYVGVYVDDRRGSD